MNVYYTFGDDDQGGPTNLLRRSGPTGDVYAYLGDKGNWVVDNSVADYFYDSDHDPQQVSAEEAQALAEEWFPGVGVEIDADQ